MNTGDRIKQLRQQQGMTLEDLGKKVGVGKSTVRKWETGAIANMRRDKIAKLADALGTTVNDILGIDAPLNDETVKETPVVSDGLSGRDLKLLEWFRSLPEEKQKAILFSQDAPEGLV